MSDIFGAGRHSYTFENVCVQDKTIYLKDEAIKVFLNPYSDMNDVDEELSNFLLFLAEGKATDDFTRQLEEEVVKARENEEWRREYMTLLMRDQENVQKGIEQGLKALIETLQGFCSDVDEIYEAVRKNQLYADITKEEIKKYL